MKRKLLFGGMPAALLGFMVLGCASTEALAIKEQGAFSAGGARRHWPPRLSAWYYIISHSYRNKT
ncbi:hypothetical protein FACS1894142_8900 [Spirochaetia bacterium]|nr:hypothetical protein FACS1894142_8900 [Spirochaetia bacterium]